MGFSIASLWKAPEVNPVNHKARVIPGLNPFNPYGRVFFISWLNVSIKKDLNLTQSEIANSNILALTVTLLVRVTAGSACDRFGPRWTFAALMLAGAIPTALAGTVTNATGLTVLRACLGVLGGVFVPCQAWIIGFFDKNVIGTATGLGAGLGNAGSGITYFLMPAIYDSLKRDQGFPSRVAWRVSFIVPFILIAAAALFMIFACPDAPTGKWSARRRVLEQQFAKRDAFLSIVGNRKGTPTSTSEMRTLGADDHIKHHASQSTGPDPEEQATEQDLLEAASWELVEKPTVKGSSNAVFSLATLTLLVTYFCSFGAELAVNSFLAAYYMANFADLSQTSAGNWASMFGLLNAVLRPIGGVISDYIYRSTGSLWGKKMLIHFLNVGMGVFLLVIGLVNPQSKGMMFGLVFGLSFFLEAGNGACFSLVPHVHPSSNGIITGVTGAAGNLGGIVFLLIVRYNHTDYARSLWIIGVVCIALNLAVLWIRPIPKGQLGGR